MRTIVLAASKGGTGKTTLAAALAALAARRAKVAVIDLDPQQSLARWLELRRHFAGKLKSPTLLTGFESVAETVAQARKQGFAWLFIDTPPALMTHILPAIENADLVLIPAKPSPLDVEAVDPVIQMCRDYEKNFEFIINMAGQRSITANAAKFLAREGKVLPDAIPNRQIYATAMTKGGTASDTDRAGEAGGALRALWEAVSHDPWIPKQERAPKAKKKRA